MAYNADGPCRLGTQASSRVQHPRGCLAGSFACTTDERHACPGQAASAAPLARVQRAANFRDIRMITSGGRFQSVLRCPPSPTRPGARTLPSAVKLPVAANLRSSQGLRYRHAYSVSCTVLTRSRLPSQVIAALERPAKAGISGTSDSASKWHNLREF